MGFPFLESALDGGYSAVCAAVRFRTHPICPRVSRKRKDKAKAERAVPIFKHWIPVSLIAFLAERPNVFAIYTYVVARSLQFYDNIPNVRWR